MMLLTLLSFCIFPFCPQDHVNKSGLDEKIEQLMTEFSVPGLQLAVMKDDSIIYVRSYGYSDKESSKLVTGLSLFRIASISKPITAITILKLSEAGKLDLDQTVFGQGGILTGDFEGITYGDRVKQITVGHLLQHKSGWTNNPDDPMFWPREYSQKQIIAKILETRPPEHEPGTKDVYSNFGYCVLGRVIEKVTGMAYEQYIRDSVLHQCGVTQMFVGGDRLDERLPGEVVYYSMESTGAYDMAIRRMDSHGGWVASASDLLAFLAKIDRNAGVSDFISSQTLKNTYFDFYEWIHTGSLPGTSAVLSRIDDHYGYAVLANTRPHNQGEMFERLRTMVKEEFLSNPDVSAN